ncbi:hypothetical protein DXG01_016160 [Tephrocybe rancida]|nr:hypothetical protein DXG01_016160 [Tephrocybe rancida]
MTFQKKTSHPVAQGCQNTGGQTLDDVGELIKPITANNTPSSTVTFPVFEPSPKHVQPTPHIRGPHLPFRRISLPTAPSKLHRESMISVASFDSMPEDREAQVRSTPAVIRNVHPPRSGKSLSISTDSPRRRRRSHVPPKVANDTLLKRRRIIEEFYETERAYVDGLELIYSHFLTPIIASLDTSDPLLDRTTLTSIFSNFIDIWNLHRSFFSSLTTLLTTSAIPSSSTNGDLSETPPQLSPILLSHFPYLSLYNPFVTSFPTTISGLADLITPPSSTRANPKYSAGFATFLAEQESDSRCGKLKLRDWLLTIVQRCPRYLLLLKDLIGCTDEEDPEHAQLIAVHALVSKITLSLNTSLHTHAQTLALLSLQRATPNLPFQLIVPGRTLLKRGSLLQIEGSGQPREREFLLFSDCLIWLAGEEYERAQWKGDWGISRSGWGSGYTDTGSSLQPSTPESSSPSKDRPQMQKSRSKSEAELSLLKVPSRVTPEPELQEHSPTTPTRPSGKIGPRKSYHPSPNMISRRNPSTSGDERWVYKGRAELVDLEVIVTPPREEGEERKFEMLSPEGSFVLYTGTEEDRDDWCSAIRQAKAQLLVSLNATHPNSTLTSSSSTNHLRRSLQALPFPPTDERIATVRASKHDVKNAKGKAKHDHEPKERRRKVEHWVPAIWIPDEKTSEWVRLETEETPLQAMWATFFIADPNAKDDSSKPARACDACYETVFPLIDPVPGVPIDVTGTIHRKDVDSFPSLNSIPSWLSIPSLPVNAKPQVLMAIDREPSSPSSRIQHLPDPDHGENHGRIKARPVPNARPRSYNQLLEDFEQNENGRFDLLDAPLEEDDDEENGLVNEEDEGTLDLKRHSSRVSSTGKASTPSSPRKENTARRNKRFSLPAVALHTTNVTARTSALFGDVDGSQLGDGAVSPSRTNKRFSLVLGNSRSHSNGGRSQSETAAKPGIANSGIVASASKSDVGKSIAAGKLSELLGRRRE